MKQQLSELQRNWAKVATTIFGNGTGAPATKEKLLSGPDVVRADSNGETLGSQPAEVLVKLEIYINRNTLPAGDHEPFSATAYYANAPERLLSPSDVDWHTSTPDVLSIDSGGVAIAKSLKGNSTITATLDGKTSNPVVVQVVVLESIFVEPQQWQMRGGEKKQFEAMGVFSDGSRLRLDTSLSWSVSNPDVIDVNKSTGFVTAKYVTNMAAVKVADSTGRIGGSARVDVTSALPAGLTITPLNISVVVGTTKQLTAMGKDSLGHEQDESAAVLWECSPPNLVSFDGKGGVTGLVVGGGKITAKDRNNASIFAVADVRVTQNDVTSISISPANPTIPLGGYQQFHAWGYFADGSDHSLDGQVAWKSSDEDAVHMGKDGNAYGRNSGSSTISANYQARGVGDTIMGGTATTLATVPKLTSISIEPANESLVVGGQRRFKAMGLYSNNKSDEVLGVDWSADGNFVSIGSSGLITGKNPGTATLKAVHKSSSKEATTKITVTSQVMKSIRIGTDNPASFDGTIIRGQRRQFRAVGVYPVGSGKEETRPIASVDWSSDKETVVSIDDKGLATALAVGSATLSAGDDTSNISNALLKVRVTESDGSSVSAADKGKLPPVVVKPYDAAKVMYQDLLTQIRQLDGIPKLIQALDSVVAEISKNAKRQTVGEANQAKGQQLLLKSIEGQVDAFKANMENAKTHIEASESDLEIFKGELEVKDLRQKSEAQKKQIDHALDAVKIGSKLSHDPVEAVVDFVKILLDLFEVDTYTKQADVLEKKLTDDKFKSLRTKIAAVKTDLENAKAALNKAKTLTVEVKGHITKLRRTAEDHFDQEANQNEKKSGKKIDFRFSQLNHPLDIANKIVTKLVPDMQNPTQIASVAITKFIHEQHVPKDSDPGKALHAMAEDTYSWLSQANTIGKQAEALRQELEAKRAKADDALADANPDISDEATK